MGTEKITRSSPVLGLLAKLVITSCARLPIGWARGLGGFLGAILACLPTKLRQVSEVNLALCLPELSPAERARLVRRSLVETGKMMLETGSVWKWSPSSSRPLIDEVVGGELLREAAESGRGAVLLLPHVGNWEVINPFLMQSYDFVALYRAPRLAELDGIVRGARERTGCEMAPADRSGVKKLFGALRDGRLVVILPDQEPVKASGAYAPFFGIPTLTMTLVPRLLRKTGASVLYCYAERRPGGRFRVRIRGASEALGGEDLEEALAQMNLGVEACVRECPEQYQWSYKRFRTRPGDEVSPYRATTLSAEERERLDPIVRSRLLGVHENGAGPL